MNEKNDKFLRKVTHYPNILIKVEMWNLSLVILEHLIQYFSRASPDSPNKNSSLQMFISKGG
jgi:hypothetical protein